MKQKYCLKSFNSYSFPKRSHSFITRGWIFETSAATNQIKAERTDQSKAAEQRI